MHFSTFTVLAVMAVAVSVVPTTAKPIGTYGSLLDLQTYISSDDLIIIEDCMLLPDFVMHCLADND